VPELDNSNGSVRLAVGRRAAGLAEQLIEASQSFAAAVFISMCVDAERDRDVGMTQDHHRVFRIHGKPLQQRRRRVTQIVKPDRAQTGSLDEALKRTSQVARFDRPTTSSGEDQPFPAPLVREVAENLMALVVGERIPGRF
jgi:hypothetical protein